MFGCVFESFLHAQLLARLEQVWRLAGLFMKYSAGQVLEEHSKTYVVTIEYIELIYQDPRKAKDMERRLGFDPSPSPEEMK